MQMDVEFSPISSMFGRVMTLLKDGDLGEAHRAARPALLPHISHFLLHCLQTLTYLHTLKCVLHVCFLHAYMHVIAWK
jgi:hypothetical protein